VSFAAPIQDRVRQIFDWLREFHVPSMGDDRFEQRPPQPVSSAESPEERADRTAAAIEAGLRGVNGGTNRMLCFLEFAPRHRK
jgi:hypothetical protein